MRTFAYTDLVIDIVTFDGGDIVTASSVDYSKMSKRERKIAERERRWREEDLEEEFDELDGILDSDY